MPSINSILNKLKSTVVQTQTKKIDAKLDQAVKDIITYRSHSGRNGYIDLVRSLISKTADVKISGVGSGLFSQGVDPTAFGQGARVMRYKAYQAGELQIVDFAQVRPLRKLIPEKSLKLGPKKLSPKKD